MPIIQPAIALSSRREAFCRHFVASGNAADAARRAGFAELHDPWTPESIELRRRNNLAWEEASLANGPFAPAEPEETRRPGDREFAPAMTSLE